MRLSVCCSSGCGRLSSPFWLATACVLPGIYGSWLRPISGSLGGLKSQEQDIHISAAYLVTKPGRVDVLLFGGPTRFAVTQDLVRDVSYTSDYPYDTATLTRATTGAVKVSPWGYNVGADVTYKFSRVVGVGAAEFDDEHAPDSMMPRTATTIERPTAIGP